MSLINYRLIIKDAIMQKCQKIIIPEYARASKLISGENWNRVLAHYRALIDESPGLNGAPARVSYRQLKGRLSEYTMKSQMGAVRRDPDTYHGVLYRLVKESSDLTIHKIVSPKNETFWVIRE